MARVFLRSIGTLKCTKPRKRPPGGRRKRQVEGATKARFVDLVRRHYPEIVFWSVEAGMHVAGTPEDRAKHIARLKREGMVTGVWDTHVLLPDGRLGCIEWKAPGKHLSDKQRAWGRLAADRGVKLAVCRSLVEGLRALQSFGFAQVRFTALPGDLVHLHRPEDGHAAA